MEEKAKLQLVSRQMEGPYVNIHYYIQWEEPDGEIRIPQEAKAEFAYPGKFVAAGKEYSSWRELCAVEKTADGHICQDIYGRDVFAEWERFPCFDSYDYLYENRYYRWFFIREGNRLTCVYYEDGRRNLTVTEDVRQMKQLCWEAIKENGWQAD